MRQQQFYRDTAREKSYLADNPNNQRYQSSHWDEPNVLAHIRMNDRYIDHPDFIRNRPLTDKDYARIKELDKLIAKNPDDIALRKESNDLWANVERGKEGVRNGMKTLHIEEIQSDWHQAGRKGGYKDAEWKNKKSGNTSPYALFQL